MSVLVQGLGRLRGAYPALLRLRLGCDNCNRLDRVFNALLKRKRSSTSSAAWIDPRVVRAQGFVVPANVANRPVNKDGVEISPDRIPENTYAHNLFLSSTKYADIVMRPSTTYAYVTNKEALEILEQDWGSMTSAESASAVKKLSYNVCHNDDEEKIDPLKYAKSFSTLNTQNLTDDDLMTIMKHLVPLRSHMEKCDFYNSLCGRIDRECIVRFSRLPREKMLYLCDVIYQMVPKVFQQFYSQYIWNSIRQLGNKPHKLSPQQLVQILFFLNIYRKPPINMYELEFQLERCMEDLSINELAVAALGFFKTSTKIRSNDFLKRIIRRTIDEIDTVETVSIAGIIKLVRYSMMLAEVRTFVELLKALTPYEPRYTLMSLAHIAQACGRVAVYDKELMDRIIGRLNRELKTARLKDFERFFYTFSIFNIDSKTNDVYENVIEELRATWDTTRAAEIAKFPHVASRILGFLTTQNVYPIDLIKLVMAPEHVNKTCSGNYHHLSREYCMLDYGLRVEVPEYDGPLLKPSISSFLEKKYYELYLKTGSADSTRANLLFTDVLTTCQELFNTTSEISVIRALPHFVTQDIVFCIDEQNQLVPSETYWSQFESSDIKYVNKQNSNIRWIALVMGHHGLLIRNCLTPTGSLAAKMRQLSKIGYTPIMISYVSWDAHKSPQEKRNYIKKLVFRDNALKLSNIT
ncbi:uncharacterized protein [Temnothorax longispinosus]|uniref:FAST kinase domain-containing protein 5 n=1 Tax=Temnothorax longispinosus TaxID=300112 RepID=A0A4S2KN87_9HYME|nr:FAST kinase domain-containing protein 5 [Temnothorax longispinosus]